MDPNTPPSSTTTTTTTSSASPPQPPMEKFYCNTCFRKFPEANRTDDILSCPLCNSEFVELIEEDNPPAQPAPPLPPPPPPQNALPLPPPLLPFAQFMRQMFTQPPHLRNNNLNPNSMNVTVNGNNGATFTVISGPFPAMAMGYGAGQPNVHIQHAGAGPVPLNNFNNLFGNIFPNFMGGGVPLAGNPGDYVFGGNFEQILNQLFQNHNHSGNPPAAKSAVDDLKKGKIEEAQLEGKPDCAICKEELALGSEYVEMPCKHIFDKECILQWLGIHNSCPVCRYELKTDNSDYENRRSNGNNNNGGRR